MTNCFASTAEVLTYIVDHLNFRNLPNIEFHCKSILLTCDSSFVYGCCFLVLLLRNFSDILLEINLKKYGFKRVFVA